MLCQLLDPLDVFPMHMLLDWVLDWRRHSCQALLGDDDSVVNSASEVWKFILVDVEFLLVRCHEDHVALEVGVSQGGPEDVEL